MTFYAQSAPRQKQWHVSTLSGHIGYSRRPAVRRAGQVGLRVGILQGIGVRSRVPAVVRPTLQQLRASTPAAMPIGVDRQNNVLRGYIVAQVGPFKTPGRGEFDRQSLDAIVRLGNATPLGLKSRLDHATLFDDNVGKFLGRARNFRMGSAMDATGVRVDAVRADLHFDQTALDEPLGGGKPIGQYVMDLAESDPAALSSSLVLMTKVEYRLRPDGTVQTDEYGDPLPPLWRPTELDGSDIVSMGDAVGGLLG
jgi:hypothetical protein